MPDYKSHSLQIPEFIKQNKFLHKEFLRAFFDDEGCVALRTFKKTGELKRNLTISSNSLRLIKQIKEIMKNNFNINSNKILKYIKKKEDKIYTNYVLSITGKENFISFRNKIGFSSVQKNNRLNQMISSYIRK